MESIGSYKNRFQSRQLPRQESSKSWEVWVGVTSCRKLVNMVLVLIEWAMKKKGEPTMQEKISGGTKHCPNQHHIRVLYYCLKEGLRVWAENSTRKKLFFIFPIASMYFSEDGRTHFGGSLDGNHLAQEKEKKPSRERVVSRICMICRTQLPQGRGPVFQPQKDTVVNRNLFITCDVVNQRPSAECGCCIMIRLKRELIAHNSNFT